MDDAQLMVAEEKNHKIGDGIIMPASSF